MATKTISCFKITLHVAGKAFKPFVFSDSGIAKEGKYDIIEVAPGTPVKLDEDEANRLIERGVAEEYVAPVLTTAPVVVAPAPAGK